MNNTTLNNDVFDDVIVSSGANTITNQHLDTWQGFRELFFARTDRVGRRLPDVISELTGKPVTGPWRHANFASKMMAYQPASLSIIAQHLAGTQTVDAWEDASCPDVMLQTYMVDARATSVATAVDFDVKGETHADVPEHFDSQELALAAAKKLIALAEALGLKTHLEITKSGGYRVWIFHQRCAWMLAKDLGRLLLVRADLHPKIEVFPKTLPSAKENSVGSAVFVPYWGINARRERQVMIDPNTELSIPVEEFVADALAYRTSPERLAEIVAAATTAGEIKATPPQRERSERTASDGESPLAANEETAMACWQAQVEGCEALREMILRCREGLQLSRAEWMRLASHLKPYGDFGLAAFHTLSAFDSRYSEHETDTMFDSLLYGPTMCSKMECGLDPQTDCGMAEGKVSSTWFAYQGLQQLPIIRPADRMAKKLRKPSASASPNSNRPAEEIEHEYGKKDEEMQDEETSQEEMSDTSPKKPRLLVNGRDYDDVVGEFVEHLVQSNNPPMLFQSAGRLHILDQADDRQGAKLVLLELHRFRSVAAKAIKFLFESKSHKFEAVEPPTNLLHTVLALGSWPGIPVCDVVTNVPLVASNGTIKTEPGYCEDSRSYLTSDNYALDAKTFTRENAVDAAQWFFDLPLSGFPFEDESSRTHALCAILQHFLMLKIDDNTPLIFIDALMRSSGKTLLAEFAMGVSCDKPRTMAFPDSEQERLKTLVSTLMERPSHLLYDNVSGEIRSSTLDGVLTSRVYSARILGHSLNMAVPINSTFLMTGNQGKLSTDLATRSIYIRLDAKCEKPEERDNFKIKNLMKWLKENRVLCVHKVLTILGYWVRTGMPLYQGKNRHRQNRWASVMGGVMESIGLGDSFLDNTQMLADNMDEETRRWRSFTETWWENYSGGSVTTGELMMLAYGKDNVYGQIVEADGVWADKMQTTSAVRLKASLGKSLVQMTGRIFSGYEIACSKNAKIGNKYSLVPKDGKSAEKSADETQISPHADSPEFQQEMRRLKKITS